MNSLDIAKRAQILGMLIEGNSIASTCRMTGAAKMTVLKLLADVGQACAEYQDKTLRNLKCSRVQCDEIWSFVGVKQRNVPAELKGTLGVGDAWTWTALCADTKLMLSWMVGLRNARAAHIFMTDVAERLTNRVQLTTDGHNPYLTAVEKAFGGNIDYAMLVKIYGGDDKAQKNTERKYSPGEFVCATKTTITGNPDERHISTSYVERSNLTMRMSCRRFTRLTNAFSKKLENHMAAIALHFMYYNFGRIHKTLRVTPAMEAGISDHVWSLEEIAELVPETAAKKRGPYKKKAAHSPE